MNRWIEYQGCLYNLDSFNYIELRGAEVCFWSSSEGSDRKYFSTHKESQELYDKIKSKLNLMEWE